MSQLTLYLTNHLQFQYEYETIYWNAAFMLHLMVKSIKQ